MCHHSSAPGGGSATLSPNSSHPAKVQGILSLCTQFTQLVLPGHWGLVFVYCTFPRSKAPLAPTTAHTPYLHLSISHGHLDLKFTSMLLHDLIKYGEIHCFKYMHSLTHMNSLKTVQANQQDNINVYKTQRQKCGFMFNHKLAT